MRIRIDGRAAGLAVEIRQIGADASPIDKAVDGAEQMILGDVVFQREFVEQRRLRLLPRSHHH